MSKQSDGARISSEVLNVLLDPYQRRHLVDETKITPRRLFQSDLQETYTNPEFSIRKSLLAESRINLLDTKEVQRP